MTVENPENYSPAQLDELNLYTKALNTVLKDEDLAPWHELDNEKKKEILPKVADLVNSVKAEDDRYFALLYTEQDGVIEMMVYPRDKVKHIPENI